MRLKNIERKEGYANVQNNLVEAADEDSAIQEAKRLETLEPEEDFQKRLTLELSDADVYEDKEE